MAFNRDLEDFDDIPEAKEGIVPTEEEKIELPAIKLNGWLKNVIQFVADDSREEVKVECPEEGVSRINLGGRQLMLMPAAHDNTEYVDGPLPLVEVLAKIPRDNLDTLTYVIPLAETNNRMHWTLLVLHQGQWHLFDPKGFQSRAYNMDPLRMIINGQESLPPFPRSFLNTANLHYTGLQALRDNTHCGYFTGHIARHIFSCFFNGADMTAIPPIRANRARSQFLSDGFMKRIAAAAEIDRVEEGDERLCRLNLEIREAEALKIEHKKALAEKIGNALTDPARVAQIVELQPQGDEVVVPEVKDDGEEEEEEKAVANYFDEIEAALLAVSDERCIDAKKYCYGVLDEIKSLQAARPESKQTADCRELLSIATLLQNPNAENFTHDVGEAADNLLNDDPSRSSGWRKLGYALLGIFGVALIVVGAVYLGLGIASLAGIIKLTTISLCSSYAVSGGLSGIGLGISCADYAGCRFFAKTARQSLKREVVKIEPEEVGVAQVMQA